MHQIREAARLVVGLVRFSISTRRVGLLVVVGVVAVAAATTATVTHLGPVAIYPFL